MRSNGEPGGASAHDLAKDFDHLDPAVARVIHETTAELRRGCPVARSGAHGGFVALTKQADIITAAMRHDEFSSAVDGIGATMLLPGTGGVNAPLFESDPPEHNDWRKLMSPFFTPTAAAEHEERVRVLTRRVVRELRPQGRSDLVADLAARIPPVLVAVLLGVPPEQHDDLARHARSMTSATSAAEAAAAGEAFADFLSAQIRDRRGRPGSDVLTAVVNADFGRGPASDGELLKFAFLMVAAGHLTTTDTIANTALVLALDPELRGRVVADPALIPELIEESVRHESAVAATGRRVLVDTRIGEVDLKPGERLLLLWGSGNRDEDVVDDGDVFRLGRGRGRQLGWGAGVHRCLGQHLARVELRVVFEELLAAIPSFELEPGFEPERTFGVLRGVRALPVRWPVEA
ncbi:cytochrome P450 [Umezawaea tangerina]|uniref:Cytochrome P450 n=1 Tax=Umezawaea tangerina TaxID=84725 RepID=A0A2T0T3W2_9PSEU|nr:cytochrome P450 [Umezawaea tangerina]PRY40323.1 cytochrome P450 [Umezawaea tangerina]